MCLIFVAYQAHPDYRLIVVANRDEFYERPAAPADFWSDEPSILAGRDLEAGGTWLGVSRGGRFAALTNYRSSGAAILHAPSRGELVSGFLRADQPAETYLRSINETGKLYNGFSMLLADPDSLWYCTNRGGQTTRQLAPGVYGLSNDLLDTSWPKLTRGKRELNDWLSTELQVDALLRMMSDATVAPDSELPDTGVGDERERELSPMFIRTQTYGTRCTTVVMQTLDGHVLFVEKTYSRSDGETICRYEFEIARRVA